RPTWTSNRLRRCMKTVVHQSLRDVLDVDAGRLFDHSRVDDALVSDSSMHAFVQNGEMRLETPRDVVRAENRDLRRVLQSIAAHQLDVRVRDWQNARAPPRRR